MAIMTVLIFDSIDDAAKTLGILEDLRPRQVLPIEDIAVVRWEPGDRRPEAKQITPVAGSHTPGHPLWVLLFGAVLFIQQPITVLASVIDTLRHAFPDFKFEDLFIRRLRSRIVEGTSALFLISRHPMVNRLEVIIESRNLAGEILSTPPASLERTAAGSVRPELLLAADGSLGRPRFFERSKWQET